MQNNDISILVEQNHERLIEWEGSNNYEKIFEITPAKIGAEISSNNRIIETSTLLMQLFISLLLLTFFSIGAYIVFWVSENQSIPSPIGWTLMVISLIFCIGISYGYFLRYREDYRRLQRVIGYYLDGQTLIEIRSFNDDLELTEWKKEEIIGFEINNLHEINEKLDRVAYIIAKNKSGKPFKQKLFRVPSTKVNVAREFVALIKLKVL